MNNRFRDEPAHTCRTINSCKDSLERAIDNLNDALSTLEDIRNANQELREWGTRGWEEVDRLRDADQRN